MPVVKVLAFDGIVPRQSPTMLADNQAQAAENVKLYSQELRTWRGPSLAYTPAISNALTIYRLYSGTSSIWLTWAADVDVAPGPVADTTEGRVYYTGEATPRKTNYAIALAGGAPYPSTHYREMGVPAPTAAPTVTLTTDGTGTAETRAYIFTYVSDFGAIREESAPSPAASVTVHPVGSTVTINGYGSAPAGAYNFTARRIYRSVAGGATDSYEFVAEVPIGTGTYADTKTAAQLGEVLPTLGWLPPPATLQGLVAMTGTGSLAGFVGNTVYFSEPYFPHAWPLAYAISLPYPIVGLAPLGSALVVMTDRYPYILNGGTPGQISPERVDILEPCVAKASIATSEAGVLYASPNGLVSINPMSRSNATRALFTRDEWAEVLPAQIKATTLDGRYFGVFPNQTNAGRALVLNSMDTPALSNLSVPAAALHVDSKNASLYYADVNDGKIYEVDADDLNPLSYEWRSKRWLLPHSTIFSALRLDADYDAFADVEGYNITVAAILAENATLFASPLLGAVNDKPLNVFTVNGSTLLEVPGAATNRSVQVIIYSKGAVVASVAPASVDPIRLPPFKVRDLEFRILGNVSVRSIAMGTTVRELKS